ncbi:KU80 protein, putative [Trypanosoma cruzi marinkellei]|uniref:KU80 protein, putative n=1 Tax=Trypanosoma cruzi marinkellei TaxID=85056 RepID=K2NFC4_TRYCR|nr:KU80 protein, putative [Trypanosoma cruzi marinkellei]
MTLRSASVFALDLNCPPASLALAAEFCRRSAETTMMFAPHDEMALVLAGTCDPHNPPQHGQNDEKGGERFKYISVPCALAAPTVEFLEPLAHITPPPPPCGRHEVDFLETLFVCDHVLRERTANKCYQRVVYLITDAHTDVARKDDMNTLLESFQQLGVSLVVIGIDFTETSVDTTDDEERDDKSLTDLPLKAQNERVLHVMCSLLGEESMVVSLEEALQEVQELRRRKITPRALVRVVLSIGDVRLATQMFTKAQEERLPTMKRMTANGEEVYMKIIFQDFSEDATPLRKEDLLKGYHYGRSLVPCAGEDVGAMKIKGPRAMDAVGFVPIQQVPAYVLLGGVKVIMPLADDMVGAKAFRSIVRAIAAANRAMIVRFVRTRDADPILGLCVPSTNEQRDVLFFSPLPYAEDVRFFEFSDYKGMWGTDSADDDGEEARLLAAIVEDMTVDKLVLRPRETFNPVIQQYYATLRAKLRLFCDGREGVGGKESCGAGELRREKHGDKNTNGEVLLPLVGAIEATSAAFGVPGNQLEPVLSSVREKLEACARSFVYVSNRENCVADERQSYRFHSPAASHDVVASDASTRAPSTVATPCFISGASQITTVDPVYSFKAIVQAREGVKVRLAMDELGDIVFKLLRCSLGDAQYAKCTECVLVLRQHCVKEGEAAYFNDFLLKLMLMARELDHDLFWKNGILARGIAPITKRECPNSTMDDEEAAHRFLTQDRTLPAPLLEDPTDEGVLNMIT